MEELDIDGLFWLAGQPDEKVAGRLKFDTANGAELNLIGAFHESPSSGAHDLHDVVFRRDDPVRILGLAGRRLLTLERCLHRGISMGVPDIVRERYSPEVIISGAHFEEDEPLEFSAVHFELQHLDQWVWRSSTSASRVIDDSGSRTGEIQIDHKPLKKSIVSIDGGELELGYSYSYNLGSITETSITQKCSFGVRFKEPRCLEDVLREATSLQYLVTIGVHSPSSFKQVTLAHADRVRTLPSGREFSEPIVMYAQFRGSDLAERGKIIHPAEMLLTFDDIGGLDGVAKWLKTSAKFRTVIDSLLSDWYLPRTYTDNRLLNSIIATEALERIRIKKQNFDFCDALIDLAVLAGDPFKAIVRDVESWAKEVVQARINHLVHRGLHENLEGKRMYDLSESLYFLVVLCLLRECGISEQTLSKMQNHRRFGWVAKQLKRMP